MKTISLFLFVLISNLTYSQRFKEILKFQIETRAGGIVYGITESQAEAEYILNDFQERNANSKYDISNFRPVYKYTTYPVESSKENPVANFKFLAGKPYKVLSAEDINALDLIKEQGFDTGVDYYTTTRNANRAHTAKRLNNIYSNLNDFRIKQSTYLAANTY